MKLKSLKLNKYDNESYGKNKGGGGWLGVAKGDCISDLNDPTGLIGGHLIGVGKGTSAGDQILDDLEQEFQFGEALVPALKPGQISGGKFTYSFTPRMYIQSLIQYNNISNITSVIV